MSRPAAPWHHGTTATLFRDPQPAEAQERERGGGVADGERARQAARRQPREERPHAAQGEGPQQQAADRGEELP